MPPPRIFASPNAVVEANQRVRVAIIAGTPSDSTRADTKAYFPIAERFWKAKGIKVVTITDLEAIFAYLKTTTDRGSLPFGEIHIVSHGGHHEWCVRAKAAAGAPSDDNYFHNARSVDDLAKSPKLAPPGATVIDAHTKIVLDGCNLGNSAKLLKAVFQLFGARATVYAPKLELMFRDDGTQILERLVDTWEIFTKQKPTPDEARTALSRAYPDDTEKMDRNATITTGYSSSADKWVEYEDYPVSSGFTAYEGDTLKADTSVVFDAQKPDVVARFGRERWNPGDIRVGFDDFRNPQGPWSVIQERPHSVDANGSVTSAQWYAYARLVCARTTYSRVRLNDAPDLTNAVHYGWHPP